MNYGVWRVILPVASLVKSDTTKSDVTFAVSVAHTSTVPTSSATLSGDCSSTTGSLECEDSVTINGNE